MEERKFDKEKEELLNLYDEDKLEYYKLLLIKQQNMEKECIQSTVCTVVEQGDSYGQ